MENELKRPSYRSIITPKIYIDPITNQRYEIIVDQVRNLAIPSHDCVKQVEEKSSSSGENDVQKHSKWISTTFRAHNSFP